MAQVKQYRQRRRYDNLDGRVCAGSGAFCWRAAYTQAKRVSLTTFMQSRLDAQVWSLAEVVGADIGCQHNYGRICAGWITALCRVYPSSSTLSASTLSGCA